MSYTIGCSPAPLTFTIRPKFDWRMLPSIIWFAVLSYTIASFGWRKVSVDGIFNIAIFGAISVTALLALIRRERIEIYSERMVWRKTYFGITRSKESPLDDVLGAEWKEGDEGARGENKGPSYIEFFLPSSSVKAGFGLSFDEFDRMREEIRTMFPKLIERWGTSSVRSSAFTLLNLN